MSSQNAFPGPNAGRPQARPTTQTGNSQPSWVNPQAQPIGRSQQPANAWPPQQQQPAPNHPDYQQPGYGGQQPAKQHPSYGQWNEPQQGGGNSGGYGSYSQDGTSGRPDPYAPQFEPYVPPSRPNFAQPQQPAQPSSGFPQSRPAPGFGGGQSAQQPAPQWPGSGTEQQSRGFDPGNYAAQQPYPAQQPAHSGPTFGQQQYHENELSAGDWAGPHETFGQDQYQQHGDPQLGFGQAEGGELEPVYNDEEYEYEDEENAPRSRRPLMIVAALVGAIVIGGGVAYGYKKFTGGGPAGNPPVIKSDDYAAKTKPADAGGKQFPYSDSKIMGRLGDGTSSASADEPTASSEGSSAGTSDTASQAQDAEGPRKVSTLVVGRDGSIVSPATPTQDQAPPQTGTAVPGTALVDVFGQQGGGSGSAPAPAADSAPAQPEPQNTDDPAPVRKAKPVKITTINAADGDNATAPPKKKFKKVARAEPTVETDATAAAPPVTASHSGTGFVAVLASIPHSTSSRIDALKRFADMQQKYTTALAGKTPDIATANLSKGVYDRLVVGPPGSRDEASNVCVQLKAQGYSGCWVTSY